MKRISLFLLFLLLPSVMANMIVSSPSINVTVGVLKSGTFTMTNNDLFDYYSIHFSPPEDMNISNVSFLGSGMSMNHTFSILSSKDYQEMRQTLIQFSRKMQIEEDPVNYSIEITNGFIPNQVTMHDIDSVIFHNAQSINHTVTDVNGSFRYVLTPNEYLNLSFTKNTTVYDEVTMNTARIIIVPFSEQYVHDESNDINLSVNVTSNYIMTTMQMTVLEEQVTCDYNGSVSSKILIQNGNATAYHIAIGGDGMNFSKQYFDVEPNKFMIIDYTVTMDITDEWETNKTHQRTITLTGANFDPVIKGVNVFVPYMNLDLRTNLERFCDQDYGELSVGERLQYDQYCSGKELVRTETKTETEVVEVEKTFGVSASDIKGWKDVGDRVAGLENTFNQRVPSMDEPLNKVNGQIQDLDFKFTEQLNNITAGLQAQLISMQAEKDAQAKKARRALIWKWVWGCLIGMAGLTILTMIAVSNHAKVSAFNSGLE